MNRVDGQATRPDSPDGIWQMKISQTNPLTERDQPTCIITPLGVGGSRVHVHVW